MIMYTVTFMIFFIAFGITGVVISLLGYLVDAAFILDILVNFNLAYDTDEVFETNRKKIAFRYLKGGIYLDLITAIPFNTIIDLVGSSDFYKILNLINLLKLLRVFKLAKILSLEKIIQKIYVTKYLRYRMKSNE